MNRLKTSIEEHLSTTQHHEQTDASPEGLISGTVANQGITLQHHNAYIVVIVLLRFI